MEGRLLKLDGGVSDEGLLSDTILTLREESIAALTQALQLLKSLSPHTLAQLNITTAWPIASQLVAHFALLQETAQAVMTTGTLNQLSPRRKREHDTGARIPKQNLSRSP